MSGVGCETYELACIGEDGEENDGMSMVFPVKMLLCCKNSDAMKSMTGIVGCFVDEWLSSAVRSQRRFVTAYVDASAMGSDVGCVAVLHCILLQVRSA